MRAVEIGAAEREAEIGGAEKAEREVEAERAAEREAEIGGAEKAGRAVEAEIGGVGWVA